MENLPDYYEILQVHKQAQQEVIEAAYRRLARLYHPDVNVSQDAHREMVLLNQAYSVLSDPTQRAIYDAYRSGTNMAYGPNDMNYAQSEANEQQRAGRNRMLLGFVIAMIAGGISLGTLFVSGGGGFSLLLWGAIAFGAFRFFQGWLDASVKWRLTGSISATAFVVGAIAVVQVVPSATDAYDSLQVGDCVDRESWRTDCDDTDALEILTIKRYPDEMAFPGSSTFDADVALCPAEYNFFAYPTRGSWEVGDRTLLCLKGTYTGIVAEPTPSTSGSQRLQELIDEAIRERDATPTP